MVHTRLVQRESLLAALATNVLLHPQGKAMRQTIPLILLIAVSAFFPVQTNPPVREVRQNHISGSVSTQPATLSDWMQTSLSRQPTRGGRFGVGDGGRAEFDMRSTLPRLDSIAAYRFLKADEHSIQVRLLLGYARSPNPQARAPEPPASTRSTPAATFTNAPSANSAGSREESRAPVPPLIGLGQAGRND